MNNSTAIPSQCPLLDPITWHPSFTNKAVNMSSRCAVVVHLLMIPAVVFFNGLTLFIVVKYEALHEQRFVVLALLAITDFLSGLTSQPLFVAKELHHLLMQDVNCDIDSAFYLCGMLLSVASFYQVTCLTYDRYVAITDPYQHATRITIRMVIYVAVTNWVINIVITILFGTIIQMKLNIIALAAPTVLLFCIIYWYIQIFKVVRRQRRSIKAQQSTNDNHESTLRNYIVNRKSAMTSLCLVAMFGLTFVPITIEIAFTLYRGSKIRGPLYFALHPWVNLSLHSCSLISPLLYGLRTSELRKYYKRVFGIRTRIEPTVPQQFNLPWFN